MKKFFAVLAVLLVFAGSAFALSDSEYLSLKKSNSDFAKADKKLTQLYGKLKEVLPKKEFAELKEDQLHWINADRDDEAEALMNKGYSRAEAYTIATNERVDFLQNLLDDAEEEARRAKKAKRNKK